MTLNCICGGEAPKLENAEYLFITITLTQNNNDGLAHIYWSH